MGITFDSGLGFPIIIPFRNTLDELVSVKTEKVGRCHFWPQKMLFESVLVTFLFLYDFFLFLPPYIINYHMTYLI